MNMIILLYYKYNIIMSINDGTLNVFQPTISGLNNISADAVNTGTITADEMDITGNIVCSYLTVNNDITTHGSIDIDTVGEGLIFPDGSIQTTAPLAQGVGVVRNYLNAYSSADQTNASTSAYNTMTFNTVDSFYGITVVSGSQITFSKTGAYLMIISAQVKKDDSGDDDVYFWVAKNGVNITDSNTLSTLSKNGDVDLVSINFGLNVVAGDYVEWRWFSADSNLYLHYDASQTINGVSLPATPSVILTVEETNSTYNSLQDLDVSGNVSITGNLDVSGNITGSFALTDLYLTGNLTVDGSANFTTSAPRTSVAPTDANDLTNKSYVDSQVSGSATALLASNNSWTGTNTFDNELTVIGVSPAKFRVETYVDTNIKNNYSDINLDSINLNITGTTNAEAIDCTNVNADAVVATSVNSGLGTFTDDSGTTALINVLEYPGGTVYTDYNPLSGDATAGWTYILYSGNGTLTYKGISTTTNIKYVAIGAGGSSAGANQGSLVSLDGGSSAGAMSGEYKDGSFNTVASSSITITIGASGNAGNGAFWTGTTYTAPTGASAGTNTTLSGTMTGSITARCGDRQGTPSTTRAHGQDASGSFSSGGFDYGYGNQTGTGSTTRPTSGEFSTTANRCIGGGGCYADQPGYITNYFTSGGTKRIDLYDGRYYYVYAGSSLATVNAEVSTPTGVYKWGHGGDGPSGKYKASGGRNGAKGGPSCVMFYFQTSTTTSIPGYALSTKGFYNSSYTIPNYDSGWFAVANNTNYTKTHNLNLSILYPPIIWFFFTYTTTPTAPIYMMFPNGLINSNTTNYNSGVMKIDPFTDPNILTFSTEANAVYYATGGTNIRYDTGYMRVIIRY